MTLVWFVVWFVSDRIGDREVLVADPANWWTVTLILAAALDLAKQHTELAKRPSP